MSRNGSGTMSVVNTLVSGTPITAAAHNQNYSDIASEITNSVAVDGQSTMTGPLKASSGTALAPSHTFGSDADTGAYRSASNEYSIAAGGSQIVTVSSGGLDVKTGSLKVAGVAKFPIVTADINDKAVTYAKIQDASTTAVILARRTAAAGPFEESTISQVLDFTGTPAQGDILVRGASDWDNLPTGTLGQQLTAGGAAANPSWGPAGGQLLHVQDSVASGGAPSSLSVSTFNTRRLNTVKTNEIAGASLASNQITLPAGTYYIDAWTSAQSQSGAGTQGLQPSLRNITTSTTILVGRTGWSYVIGGGASQPMDTQCNLTGRFTLSGTSVLEFRNYLSGIGSVNGGNAMSSGDAEVYTDVKIWRVA